MATERQSGEKLRIDKWLWAARFFKTRALAAEAVDNGRVLINKVRVKPAKSVMVGDQLEIHVGQQQFLVEVLGLSLRRGPASEAQNLYLESDASRQRRVQIAEQNKRLPQYFLKGRPSKRDRREIERYRRIV